MKISTPSSGIKTSGINHEESINFRVANTPHLMQLLSDSLYSDKILAPIRELATNAYDSHITAGKKEIPFEITLPTCNDPVFKVKDFGTGLSSEDIHNIYTVYGLSDKTHTNELIGCMGLGSKSPLAYTDSFTIISRYNGISTTYVVAKDSRGLPTLHKLGEASANGDGNGVEISFGVKSSDVSLFQKKAKQVVERFSPIPKTHPTIPIENKSVVFEGKDKDWKMYENTYPQTVNAIMGNVAYPIEKHNDKFGNYHSGYYSILNTNLDLYFNLGKLDVNVSREGLQYNSHTVDNIKSKLDKVKSEISSQVTNGILKCKTLWEARQFVRSKYNNANSGFIRTLLNDAQWQGQNANHFIKCRNLPVKVKHLNKTHQLTHKPSQIVAWSKVGFVVNDSAGPFVRSKELLNSGKYDHIYVISEYDDKSLKDFCLTVGIPFSQLIFSSTLPKPSRKKNTNNTIMVNRDKYYIFDANRSFYRRCIKPCWKDVNLSDVKDFLYIPIANYKVIKPPLKTPTILPNRITDIINNLKNLKISIPPIIGVKNAYADKFVKNVSNTHVCESFWKWLEKQYNDYLKKHNLQELLEYYVYRHNFKNLRDIFSKILDDKNSLLLSSGLFKQLMEKSRKYEKQYSKLQSELQSLSKLRCIIFDQDIQARDFGLNEQILLEKYPLLACVLYNSPSSSDWIDYINLVDKNQS